MCAFLSRPHQANPHLFENRNLCRPNTSSVAIIRPGRLGNVFCSLQKFPPLFRSKTSSTGFSGLNFELSNPRLSSFVVRSSDYWGSDFVQEYWVATLSTSDIPLRSPETSSAYNFLSRILHDFTPTDAISFTFVSTILGIITAYIVRELNDRKASPSLRSLDYHQQDNLRALNASSTVPKYGESRDSDIWLNLSRPSPFFRSVCARCPSLASSSSHQYVQRLRVKKPDYQRKCLPASDGGTVALDWPAHLDIGDSKELENIMLLVCGTSEGSNEDGMIKFSQMVEQHGYFPVVFNPRGCGGSPLTTPRVFSAADSDDVRLAVQFIAKSRPWAAFVSVGWGLGAHLLARYLGEEGSYTPLTAAVCTDNPFDLSAVTRPTSGSRWRDFDDALCKSLVQILDSNKMLFQGETKGFDVNGALAATSVRDFDRAISRVAHGYNTVEDFYVNTSCGAILEGVQIPLLCIQHLEDCTRNQASIPHEVLDRNVYTMLLASKPSDSKDEHPGAASEWTHAISLEWLTAVEISILKGRHPQLSEFSPTLKLPREWSNIKSQYSGTSLETLDRDEVLTVPSSTSGHSSDRGGAQNEPDLYTYGSQDYSNGHLQNEESTRRSAVPSKPSGEGDKGSESPAYFEERRRVEQQSAGQELTEAEKVERGQVVQVAETVMNVLDVTMPGTLADSKKQEVLNAVGRGETIVTALEEAVPEEVRGTMSTAVSEVILAQGLSPKMAGSPALSAGLPTGVIDRLQETFSKSPGKTEAPKSDLDVTLRSGNEGSDGKEISGNKAQSDDPTEEITPGKSDQNPKKEKDTSKDKVQDGEQGTVATKSDERSEPSKTAKASSNDPKDGTQQVDVDQKSGGGKKGSADAISKVSTNGEDQTRDQSQNKNEDPVPSTKTPAREAASGENSKVTGGSDEPAKTDVGLHGPGGSTANEKMDVKGQADSEDVRGGSVSEKNSKKPKDAESKGEVADSSSKSDLSARQTDVSNRETSGSSPGAEPTSSDVPNSDAAAADMRSDNSNSAPPKSTSSGSQTSEPSSSEVPSETSNAPLPRSQESQSDPLMPEVSSDASNSPLSSPVPPQNEPRDTQTAGTSPSPPAKSAPTAAPENPPPQGAPVPLPSMGEAVQALTGFDDSTQMAVTNVFGVVENVLDQLEQEGPSTDANNSGMGLAEEVLHQAAEKRTTISEQNAPDGSEADDEDVKDESMDDKNGKEFALAAETKQKSIKGKTTGLSVAAERADAGNGSSRVTASSRGGKPHLSTNERGYVTDVSELESSDVEKNQPNPLSIPFESDNTSNSVHGSPAQDFVDEQSLADNATHKKLQLMAEELNAEGEEIARRSASGNGKVVNSLTAVQQDDSSMVTDLVMRALKLEVVRRLGAAGLEAVGVDLEKEVLRVAHAVSEVVTMGKDKLLGEGKSSQGLDSNLGGKLGILNGNSIVTALGSVLGGDSLLGRLLPVGVLAGVVMASLGATYLIVSDDQEERSAQMERSGSQIEDDRDALSAQVEELSVNDVDGESEYESSEGLGDALDGLVQDEIEPSVSTEEDEEWHGVDGEGKSTEQAETKPPHQGKLMGAMAAAMGATAAVASTATSTSEGESGYSKGSESGEQKLVPDIAEKAIAIVSPVIPRTEAGELDHERLVSLLTELGQRGGPLTLVGKVALLWGGLRGAMSLADRLLAFFRIKERPLHQRLLGFGGMAVVLWTPVLVPLLPTLLQQWATKSPSGVADAAAGIGLYGAIFILVTIWGTRVRGYERPLVSYGVHLFSRAKLRLFAGGLAIGVGLGAGYYGLNWVLGYSQFSWNAIVVSNPNFPGALVSSILTSWKVLMLVTQSLATAVAVALVEEVLFRAWLKEEIAVDLGHHWAVLLSALAFAVAHRSPPAIVGLWFLAVALSGARARTDGDLSFPIGIHGGLVSAFSVMNLGGLVRYTPESPSWITGVHAGNPLAGALGIGMVAVLAIALYPRKQGKFRDGKVNVQSHAGVP